MNNYVCNECGRKVKLKTNKRYHCVCGNKVEPTISKKILNFTKAVISHTAKGIPTCSDEQIKERLRVCQDDCPFYTGITCSHIRCGCKLVNKKKFLNKLAWADQECPDGRWGQVQVREESKSQT